MIYNFNEIEAKWQKYWAKNQTFKAENNSEKPKYYVLDMFPYPSGAGLHVGHPLGYIASDIYARYKRHQGFNVLHPQGYDSFGLPAEQYAIQTGQHPALTTEENIKTYRRQLDQIGFSFDWSREVRTSDPSYYKWTQWIFIQLFNSWYNKHSDKAEDISELIKLFASEGNSKVNAVSDDAIEPFSAEDWNAFDTFKQQQILLQYRLTYLAETEVNWCPALGTVLANDEIVNGVSERGGHPVIRKKMTQWSMRISAYAERLLQGLETIDWTESLKETQRNWIGKSVGASVAFPVIANGVKQSHVIDVFTTRPDTIFGVSFMTLAPEHELVSQITTPAQKAEVENYIEATAKRSERDRMSDVKTISGAFTGAYVEHPFTKESIPVWIGDYVLAGYGTGAVMSVPCGDQRDYDFAKHFNIPIPNIFSPLTPEGGTKAAMNLIAEVAFTEKSGFVLMNSGFLNGLGYKEATQKVIIELEKLGQGQGKTNYRLRDAVFSRQRYWGEPFPVYYVDGMPQMIDAKHLPIKLPEVEKYLPTETGEPPLGNAKKWYWLQYGDKADIVSKEEFENSSPLGRLGGALELNTMPGWAGSSWYFNRYMDAHNENEFASKKALNYWQDVDLYIGGSEHATGHLLYSRFWQKFLFDKGLVPVDEFAKKLINQGMILGMSAFVYRVAYINGNSNVDNSEALKKIPVFLLSETILKKYNQVKNGLLSTIELNDKLKLILSENYNISDEILNDTVPFISELHVDLSCINDITNELDIEKFKAHPLYADYKEAEFILEDGKYIVGREVEKMSKSKYNVVNPDQICEQYGADSLRLYEMFLGPLEQYKPWNTAGITGVHGFLKKLWRLYHRGDDVNTPDHYLYDPKIDGDFGAGKSVVRGFGVIDTEPTKDNLKTFHKTIKKVQEDIENFSFNTSVSTFMIAVNEFTLQECKSRAILEPFLILLSPYAPHIAEELWEKLGHDESISTAPFPIFDASHLVESSKNYPISFNGKMKFTMELPMDFNAQQIEDVVMAHEKTQEQLQGRAPKKVIIVPGKIVNIVG